MIASYGGEDSFNVPFVPAAILETLHKRRDLVFLFMNYPPFLAHERAIFLPGNPDPGIQNALHQYERCDDSRPETG